MPKYALLLKAELENIRELRVVEGNGWVVDLQMGGEERDSVVITSAETAEIEGSRGKANFVIKIAGRPASVTVLEEKSYVADAGGFQRVASFEVRGGVEVTKWHATRDFVAVSEGGTEFADGVDLSEGDWADYDEANDMPVSVISVETKVEKLQ